MDGANRDAVQPKAPPDDGIPVRGPRPGAAAEPTPQSVDRLAALRAAGASELDPIGLRYLEALSRRTQAATGAPRRLLELRLEAAMAQAADRLQRSREADAGRGLRRAVAEAGLAPLRALNQRLRELGQPVTAVAPEGEAGPVGELGPLPGAARELKGLRGFRRTWSRISAENLVRRAVDRQPENAGPLNSHMLVLRSLELMQELSPDYLQRFLSRLDALLWLEQADAQRAAAAEPKAPRRGRRKKDAT
jgi:hypothetical protein